jgi:hypothetical protein
MVEESELFIKLVKSSFRASVIVELSLTEISSGIVTFTLSEVVDESETLTKLTSCSVVESLVVDESESTIISMLLSNNASVIVDESLTEISNGI